MIAHIRGTIAEKFGNSLIVDVNGVGYEMAVSALDFDASKLNEEKKFYIVCPADGHFYSLRHLQVQ